MSTPHGKLLGIVTSAAGGTERRLRPELAEPAVARGYTLAITLTPHAEPWFAHSGELAKLQALTPHPVRARPRLPTEPKPYPMPDAFVFVPATANSVAKLALGICDNQALTAVTEAMGRPGVPVLVCPQANEEHRDHPAWAGHLATLGRAGVHIVELGADTAWSVLLDELDSLKSAEWPHPR